MKFRGAFHCAKRGRLPEICSDWRARRLRRGEVERSNTALREQVRRRVLPHMDPADWLYWIIDDTGFPRKGKHSVGVARQYCGQLCKPDNCQAAVSLSVATEDASLPVSHRLHLPREWSDDPARRQKAGVPGKLRLQRNRRLRAGSCAEHGKAALPTVSRWPMRAMETTPRFARPSASSGCNMRWVFARTRAYGRRARLLYHRSPPTGKIGPAA